MLAQLNLRNSAVLVEDISSLFAEERIVASPVILTSSSRIESGVDAPAVNPINCTGPAIPPTIGVSDLTIYQPGS